MRWAEALGINRFDGKGVKNSMLLVCAHVRDWKIYRDKLSEYAPAETCKVNDFQKACGAWEVEEGDNQGTDQCE